MDGAKYCQILEENALLSARKLKMGRRFTFQPDGDPKHTDNLTTQRLKEKKVDVLACPCQSPGLNSIENLWNYLKNAVHQGSPSNLTELEHFCKEQ